YAIIEAPEHGWMSMPTMSAFAIALTFLAVFVWWELRTRVPMLDLRWFQHRALSVGSAGMMLSFFALYGMMFLLTQYLQLVHGYSPLGAAVRLMPIAAVVILGAAPAPRPVRQLRANPDR